MPTIGDFASNLRSANAAQGECYHAIEGSAGEKRIDFRKANGERFSLPYAYLIDVQIASEPDGVEAIRLDYNGLWHVTLLGNDLLPLYEALGRQEVVWISEADSSVPHGQTQISSMIEVKLTDPAMQWSLLNEQRQAHATVE